MHIRYLSAVIIGIALLPMLANAASTPGPANELREVRSFRLMGHTSWRSLDRDTLIVWTSPSRPYLVELRHPSPDLRFAQAIGVTSLAGRVSAGFDDVIVEGSRYPIRSIYALDRAHARELLSAPRGA